jgi:hypothetical protein
MRLYNFVTEAELNKLNELEAPMLGAPVTPGVAPAPVAAPAQDPNAAAKAQAMAAKQMVDQKKNLMDQIKQKQEEIVAAQKALQDMQKQLAQIR